MGPCMEGGSTLRTQVCYGCRQFWMHEWAALAAPPRPDNRVHACGQFMPGLPWSSGLLVQVTNDNQRHCGRLGLLPSR